MENEIQIQTPENGNEVAPNTKQQDKLITYFATGENVFSNDGNIFVDDETRQSVLDRMGTGDISRNEKIDALMRMASPMDLKGPEAIFAELELSSHIKQIKGILACFDFETSNYDISPFRLGNFNKREYVTSDSLISFFDKYKDPISFKNAEAEFIKIIAKTNDEKKASEYKDSMSQLKVAVFGNRQEFYNQIQLLQEEANARQSDIEAHQRPLTNEERVRRGYAGNLDNRATELPELGPEEIEESYRSETGVRKTGGGVISRLFNKLR